MQRQGIDLHLHTTCSDGTRTVAEMIQDAKEFGLNAIAITDHNQFALCDPMYFDEIDVIPGAEFSTFYRITSGRLLEVHVVGLFFEGVPKELQSVFRKISIQRKQYLDAIITRLNNLGISLSYEELVYNFPDSNQIGRRHIAEILVKKGYAESITDVFDRLIGNRSPYWVDSTKYMKYMSLESCVHKICEYGGLPILAHPYHYHCTDEEVMELIRVFKEMAGDHPAGLEVYYSKYDQSRRAELLKIAECFGLYPSAASDRHGRKDPFECGDPSLLTVMKQACKVRKHIE